VELEFRGKLLKAAQLFYRFNATLALNDALNLPAGRQVFFLFSSYLTANSLKIEEVYHFILNYNYFMRFYRLSK